ncbi:MAG: hypothetical protein GYA66_06330 [Phyllobacteriaceae bacterium]|jgi:uncharacterized membrane protein YbhN (UPF0104 family)|nr:hypothetical protein [Phyllobacteriaceae bacterium]
MVTGSFGLFILVLILIGGGIYYWLASREKKRVEAGQSRLATWRLLLASVFALVALFSGGCSLLFVPSAIRGDQYVDPAAVLVLGGVPFAVAALILWLSLRRGNG